MRIKLFAFGIGAGIAGVAGALYAHQATYIDFITFNVMMSVEILTFVVVGGGSTYWGPVVGAVALSLLPHFLRTLREWLQLVPVAWTIHSMNKMYDFLYAFLDFENAKRLIAYGLILIVMMIVRPDGLITRDSLPRLSFKRWRPLYAQRAPATTCLAIEGLTKRFGGFYAVNDLQLEVATGDIHALIGPNGAGKTTFFYLVTGVLPADSGEVQFEGVPMLDTRASRRTLKGIARTFQNIRLFPHLTVLETVVIGEHCRLFPSVWQSIPCSAALQLPFVEASRSSDHAYIGAHALGILRACRQARRQSVGPSLRRPASP